MGSAFLFTVAARTTTSKREAMARAGSAYHHLFALFEIVFVIYPIPKYVRKFRTTTKL